jgi:hypothetical protein
MSFALFASAVGSAMHFHDYDNGKFLFFFGFMLVLLTMFS